LWRACDFSKERERERRERKKREKEERERRERKKRERRKKKKKKKKILASKFITIIEHIDIDRTELSLLPKTPNKPSPS
jgi:hypothetical protein